jgi:hypothetical protein
VNIIRNKTTPTAPAREVFMNADPTAGVTRRNLGTTRGVFAPTRNAIRATFAPLVRMLKI